MKHPPDDSTLASEADGRLLYALMHNGREFGGPGASTDAGTLRYYRHVAGLFLARRMKNCGLGHDVSRISCGDAARVIKERG